MKKRVVLLLLILIFGTGNYVNAQVFKGAKYKIKKKEEVTFVKKRKLIRNKAIIKNKTTDSYNIDVIYNEGFVCEESLEIVINKENRRKALPVANKIKSIKVKNSCTNFYLHKNIISNSLPLYNVGLQQGEAKYNILYDIGNDKIAYYKNGIYKKRINPYVNSILRFTYINYNSISDSITLKAQFIDRNTEDQELFNNIIKAGLKKPEEETEQAEESKLDTSLRAIGVENIKELKIIDFNCNALLDYLKDADLTKDIMEVETKLTKFINKGVFNNIDTLTNYTKTCTDLTEGQLGILFSVLEKLNSKKLTENIDSLNAFHTRMQIESGAVDKKYSYLLKICKNLNVAMKSVDTDISKLYRGDSLNFKKKFMEAYKQVYNYNPPLYNWLQIKNNDVVKLNFEHYSNNKKKSAHELELLTWGGLKIDFSTGFVVHGLTNENYLLKDSVHFRDNEANIYSQRPNDTIAVTEVHQNIITNDPLGDFNYAFSAMSHLYFRTGTRVNVGLTTGFTTDLQSDFRFLAGASFLLGSEKRWVISGGIIGGKHTVLSDGFKIGDVYSADNNTPPTKQEMDYKWFIGISYNLGGVKLSK